LWRNTLSLSSGALARPVGYCGHHYCTALVTLQNALALPRHLREPTAALKD
jgi:hypothetical protein